MVRKSTNDVHSSLSVCLAPGQDRDVRVPCHLWRAVKAAGLSARNRGQRQCDRDILRWAPKLFLYTSSRGIWE